MNLKVENKHPEEVTLAELIANLDSMVLLILFAAIMVILVVSFLSGMVVLSLWPQRDHSIAFLGVVPGVAAGYSVSYLLFRFRRDE